jgi:hypothetical protein
MQRLLDPDFGLRKVVNKPFNDSGCVNRRESVRGSASPWNLSPDSDLPNAKARHSRQENLRSQPAVTRLLPFLQFPRTFHDSLSQYYVGRIFHLPHPPHKSRQFPRFEGAFQLIFGQKLRFGHLWTKICSTVYSSCEMEPLGTWPSELACFRQEEKERS